MKKYFLGVVLLVGILGLVGCGFLLQGEVNGVVTDKITKEKIADVKITVGTKMALTTEDGTYVIDDLKAGTHLLTAEKEGYVVHQEDITVTANQATSVNVELSKEVGLVQGTVCDQSTGDPIADVSITIGNQSVQTDETGVFQFQSLPIGVYQLQAQKEGFVVYEKEITVTTGQTTSVQIELVAKVGTIKGYINEKYTDEPLEGVTVTVGTQSVQTDEYGYFKMYQVRVGEHLLKAQKDGYLAHEVTVLVANEEEKLINFDLEYASLGNIGGTIIDKLTDQPLADVMIMIGGFSTISDAQGQYLIEHVKEGTHMLDADLPNYHVYQTNVEVIADETSTWDFVMEPIVGAMIVKVYDENNDPLFGVDVTVANQTLQTDQYGGVDFTELPVGTHELTLSKEGYQLITGEITVDKVETKIYTYHLSSI